MFVLLITVKRGKFRRWQPTESKHCYGDLLQ